MRQFGEKVSDFRALLATQSRHPLRKVVNVGLESEIKSSFMQYAMSIILVRCVLMLMFGSAQVATKSAVDTRKGKGTARSPRSCVDTYKANSTLRPHHPCRGQSSRTAQSAFFMCVCK